MYERAQHCGFGGFSSTWALLPESQFIFVAVPVGPKYKFRAPVVAPYFDAGPTIRSLSSPLDRYLSSVGLTAGVGAELPEWKICIAPEVRFVHWGSDSSGTATFYASRRNQAQFPVGFVY